MKRAIVTSFLVCALIATAGCLDDGDTEADATMSVAEIGSNYHFGHDQANGTVTFWISSVDDGDTLVIKDTIANITYDEQNDTSTVMFTSNKSNTFTFEGNISDEFSPGDTVAVITHIINVTMERSGQGGQTVTYYYETFKEGWDAANETTVPFPRSTIEHAEAIEDTDDTDDGDDTSGSSTMTFSAFWNDYAQSVDNESLVATTYLKSLDDGDTVTIEDTLHNLSYNATQDYTLIQFSSVTQRVLAIEGDITDEFQAGDAVSLTSKIINATFTYPVQGQNWTIHYETFAGGWDTENNTQVPFPRDALQHAD